MGSPGSHPCFLHDDPIALLEGLHAGAGGYDFEGAFVPCYRAGSGISQGGGERRTGRVDSLDLVYVGWVQGCGE